MFVIDYAHISSYYKNTHNLKNIHFWRTGKIAWDASSGKTIITNQPAGTRVANDDGRHQREIASYPFGNLFARKSENESLGKRREAFATQRNSQFGTATSTGRENCA